MTDRSSLRPGDRKIFVAPAQNVRLLVERVSPGPYRDMYGREDQPNCGCTVFGNQVERRLF